jgi:glycosyltransferase 2 family protein
MFNQRKIAINNLKSLGHFYYKRFSFLSEIFFNKVPKWIKLLFSLFFIVVVLYQVNINELATNIKSITPTSFISILVLSCFISFLMSMKWRVLLSFRVANLRSKFDFYLSYWIADFYSLLGFGSILSDLKRASFFKSKKTDMLLIGYLDKILSLSWHVLTLFAFFLLKVHFILFILFILLFIIIFAFLSNKYWFISGSHFVLSVISLFSLALGYYLIYLGFDVYISMVDMILYITLVNIALVLPISFSGVGLRELVTIYFFTYLNVDVTIAIVASSVFFVSNILYKLMGGLIELILLGYNKQSSSLNS